MSESLNRRKTNRVTMDGVATQAKVSPSTVSLYLRDPKLVSVKRAERIQAAIEATGYTVNRMAGALAGNSSRAVAVIVPSMINAFFSETLQALQDAFEARGYQLLISNCNYDTARELELLRAHLSWSPAALVLTGTHHGEARALLERTGVPIAQMWELGGEAFHLQVGFHHHAVGAALAEHLYDTGLREFTYVGARMQVDQRARQRADGFCGWLAERGCDTHVIALEQGTDAEGIQQVFEHLAHQMDRPHGLCCSNDVLAIAALFEAQRRGITVPNMLAVAGFGDLPLAALSEPRLTTVRPYPERIGRTVAQRLLYWLDQGELPGRPETIDVGFELIVRDSTSG